MNNIKDCEYFDRCENRELCFMCFNLSKLKLKENKYKKKGKTKPFKKTSKYDLNKKDSWKTLEKDTADKLKEVPTIKQAEQTAASGRFWFDKGDVKDFLLRVECKERGQTLKSGEKTISIHKAWLEKADEEAKEKDQIMCNAFRFKGDETIYANMKFDDITELVNMYKALTESCMLKDQIIEELKEKIKSLEGK